MERNGRLGRPFAFWHQLKFSAQGFDRPSEFIARTAKIAPHVVWILMSYAKGMKKLPKMARETGLEPATSGVTGRRSSNPFNDRFDSSREITGHKA